LIDQCDLFISNDTGVMHIAGLTNTILVALMNKGNIREWAPMGKNKFYIYSSTDNINDLTLEEVQNFCDKILNLIKWRRKLI
ncbi:MAG: glycosyltransferase family 9 protein, partial [Ignavibacteria bacterium]